jgi:hypothetical protein
VLNLLRDLVSSFSSSVSSCSLLLLLSSHHSSPPSASHSSHRLSSPLIHFLLRRGAGHPYQCSYLPSRPPLFAGSPASLLNLAGDLHPLL